MLLFGILFANGRRTVSTWLRAAGVSIEYDDYYYFLAALGRKTKMVATSVLTLVLRSIPLPQRLLLAIDDTPTKRYGPRVEGADIHRNPTPGPADQEYLYGHIWVTLALAIRHPWWGPIGLPLLGRLYVRERTMESIPSRRGWKFRTKLELAAQAVEWIAPVVRHAGKQLWLAVDGAYAKRPFLRAAAAARAVVVSRLRKDAHLRNVPTASPRKRRRGRPRRYGRRRISLAKRAGQKRGWSTVTCAIYGKETAKKYKTFLATYAPAGGLIRVVLVQEDDGSWQAFFCTDPTASARQILEAFADRATIEQVFHDVKEVWGTGKQQVRNIWTNVAVYNLNLWVHTLIELWAWNRCHEDLCDRSASPSMILWIAGAMPSRLASSWRIHGTMRLPTVRT